MSDKSAIEWCDATWNPLVGCSHVSPGCDNCYAAQLALRHLQPDLVGLSERTENGPRFTGEIRLRPHLLDQPLRWHRPRKIFVNSQSDLFHKDVLGMLHEGQPFLAHVFARMVAAERHTFQVLTKRPQFIAPVLRHPMFKLDVNSILLKLGYPVMPGGMSEPDTLWPANIILGTSIENDRYCFRADQLRAAPAAKRFLSLEPLLGPLPSLDLTGIDWVIVGGESGPRSRPMAIEWARDIRDRCADAGIPFLFKQWGEHAPVGSIMVPPPGFVPPGQPADAVESWEYRRVGKRAAGRELDGVIHDGYPT